MRLVLQAFISIGFDWFLVVKMHNYNFLPDSWLRDDAGSPFNDGIYIKLTHLVRTLSYSTFISILWNPYKWLLKNRDRIVVLIRQNTPSSCNSAI